ncbi:RNA dependent RNA polymerase-domain-containing protein [Aspergillus avenaceus]|uniref:RNA-dependent RNA polymerase n=1 Tax=Aspergillus avenaceus TaxID=36643 RepID=A0A5N6U1R7_ASPAV|nr:RNA dependent RNA polymerase-domain-containing protein [Aspergillus avenaceus]
MAQPRTPIRRGKELHQLIDALNEQYGLDIPNPKIYSPSVRRDNKSSRWRIHTGLKRLYYDRSVDLDRILYNFEEWVSAQSVSRVNTSNRQPSTSSRWLGKQLLINNGHAGISESEKDEYLRYLLKLLDDELYIVTKGSFRLATESVDDALRQDANHQYSSRPMKRRFSDEGEYHTAPSSPVKNPVPGRSPKKEGFHDQLERDDYEDGNWDLSPKSATGDPAQIFKSPRVAGIKSPSGFLQRLLAPDNIQRYDAVPSAQDVAEVSFATTTTTEPRDSIFDARPSRFDTSFVSTVTDVTEPEIDSSDYEDSVVAHMLSQETRMALDRSQAIEKSFLDPPRYSVEQQIRDELLESGPFSRAQSFPRTVPLRYRYELERIGRAWGISSARMLVGSNISFKSRDGFWKWIEGHSQREGRPLPEKSSSKAWDAAVGDFKTERHSEVVVLTGDLEWCTESERGILKLNLNPLKVERTCRFHRRFGSDRFLSLTLPAPARPPKHLRLPENPSLLRESIALWLTQNVHRCLGRTWKPFFVEEVKSKSKHKASEPKFRVDFFAIDGIDFDKDTCAPPLAPAKQPSDGHTPMSLDALINWHMPRDSNVSQSNCKLFQRFSLGLSKTYATVALKPWQVLHLRDAPGTVMNDGCALMSRGLANKICDSLGITGNTPSAFQGRIAGAKGLWMVDRHESDIFPGNDVWIQITDSQLKIKPHPQTWHEPVDEEKLTFEVVKWSKPLHPVDLNTQLLAILEYGGHIKEYIANLTRAGIQSVYQDFVDVIESNSPILCRSLIQKIKPGDADSSGALLNRVKRLEQWVANDAEAAIRLTEAGFCPRSFHPLRLRLRKCLTELLDQYVNELHIEVPLSTYAFCIADPYGVLKEDEVHFGFSSNWHDPQGRFEDNLLDGVEVLVARLPAHLPSDIQRRRAVWKPELRHFKDVIVFPTVGEIPLAHMLSGGDYDGDTPWVCWDQKIVQNFRNSNLPSESYPQEHYGLTTHNVPMRDIRSSDEFLESTFTFNLTISNLGRCTVEHEKLSYDESIDSPEAKELACLLSHLVDGRKGGVLLSEDAWQKYRKRISPRFRQLPAYKNPDRKPRPTNIIDYLRFIVAEKERNSVLKQLNRSYPEGANENNRDEDLVRPWQEAINHAEQDRNQHQGLRTALEYVGQQVNGLDTIWRKSIVDELPFSSIALMIADRVQATLPPEGDHPLIYIWQQSREAWLQVLASHMYWKNPHSKLVWHAFGEALCELKAKSAPSRSITHDILACYRVNQKAVARLAAHNMSDDELSEEFEDEEAVAAMLHGTQMPGGYPVLDDGFSMEPLCTFSHTQDHHSPK